MQNWGVMDVSVITVDGLCRCCKGINHDMLYIFDDVKSDSKFPRMDEMLMACTPVIVYHNDGMPSYMCKKCVSYLKAAYAFRRTFERTDGELRKLLKLTFNDGTNEKLNRNDDETKDDNIQGADIEEEAEDKSIMNVDDLTDIVEIPELTVEESNSNDCALCTANTRQFEPPATMYQCKLCKQVRRSKLLLKRHLRSHLQDKPFVCNRCSSKFRLRYNLRRHRQVCNGIQFHYCEACNLKFRHEANFKQHWKKSHKNDHYLVLGNENLKKYQSYFEKVTKNDLFRMKEQDALKQYGMISQQKSCDLYHCYDCGSTIKGSAYALMVHMRQHQINYKCRYCGDDFSEKAKLYKHELTHTAKEYACTTCGLKFNKLELFETHVRSHAGLKHKCRNWPKCKELFADRNQLLAHMAQHEASQLRTETVAVKEEQPGRNINGQIKKAKTEALITSETETKVPKVRKKWTQQLIPTKPTTTEEDDDCVMLVQTEEPIIIVLEDEDEVKE